MKGLNLFLATCFVVPTLGGAVADTVKNSARATSNRPTATTNSRNASNVKQRGDTKTAQTQNVATRGASSDTRSTKTRATATPVRESSVVARSTKKPSTATTTARTAKKTQSAITSLRRRLGLSRAATTQTRESVMQRDFGKCKSVFFDCMDEFCANKDSQLKRCACSARTGEFKNTQKSLDNVEDKLLDFSQRLLQVNMDPADAAVINQESEGERAYNATKDKTASRKTLDEIAAKLNTSFDSAERNNMSALSWSLDMDTAFDSVDSLSGVSTTAKSGVALRNAALPICREMAAEVCSDNDISLVENSYNMAIEQDCNTVRKSYETQTATARNKILESGALLDMTRLNNYQENNSDDILTCKSKMLNTLTNTNVCGENLTKCLDISGRYINPTTGTAFLSPDLVQLSDLIARPTNGDNWSRVPKNSSFISFLNSKKKYIEPATKNCQAIADDVWNGFIDDALSQIKIAQNAKLEEIRQSCTTLMAECLDDAKQNLSDFDSRALSTFGVMTDKTANALCENVKASCSAVMEYTPDDTVLASDMNWGNAVTEIQARETYETIINTCREVGRACIINACYSISGNFGLCESITNSINRHSILSRAACWDEVYNCVSQATDESIAKIRDILPNTYNIVPQSLYNMTYYGDPNGTETVWDICREGENKCGGASATANTPDPDDVSCYKCRIAEQIWGNCKMKPDNRNKNKILPPRNPDTTTLLYWFATNTHTQEEDNSCATSMCPYGQIDVLVGTSTQCYAPSNVAQCSTVSDHPEWENILCIDDNRTPITNSITNCCPTNNKDRWSNCCMSGSLSAKHELFTGLFDTTSSIYYNVRKNFYYCTPNTSAASMTLVAKYNTGNNTPTNYIFCVGSASYNRNSNSQIIQDEINCSGEYIVIECNNNKCYYKQPQGPTNCSGNACQYTYGVNYYINVNMNNTEGANLAPYCTAVNEPSGSDTCKMTGSNTWQQNCPYPSYWLVDFNN